MAYTKILHIKNNTHLQDSLNYITDPKKTDGQIYVASYNCDIPYAVKCFEEIAQLSKIKKGNNIAHHLIQSFAPEDNITPEQAMQIGQHLMRRLYSNHQYVIATHIDNGQVHNHIIINAVNFATFTKLHCNKKNLEFIRNTSDDLCRENGLTVIQNDSLYRKEILISDIDKCIEIAENFDGFITLMQDRNYKIKIGEHLYFKGLIDERYRRSDTLGFAYSEVGIKKRIQGIDIPKGKKTIYADKSIKMSNRKRLKYAIDDMLKTAADYNDFLNRLKDMEIEIKHGKHLAMRIPNSKRYIRVEKYGEEYTEDNLKLYFEDRAAYEKIKSTAQTTRIEKLSSKNNRYNKYAAAHNVDIQIRMLNILSESNIKSIDELRANIVRLEKQSVQYKMKITSYTENMNSNRAVIKAIKNYWRLKPIFEEYNSFKFPADKEIFMLDHKKEIEQYKSAVELINLSKFPDGTLPKASALNSEITEIKSIISEIEKLADKINTELLKYHILAQNLKTIGIDIEIQETTKNVSNVEDISL